jgi:hypothetical protein
LLDEPRRALRPLTVNLTFQFGDAQLLRRDQRLVLGGFRVRHRQLRGGLQPLLALGDERRLQDGDIVGKRVENGSHGDERITFRAICGALKCLRPHAFREGFRRSQPALAGLQVSCGLRQSIPSSM